VYHAPEATEGEGENEMAPARERVFNEAVGAGPRVRWAVSGG
jgi:hypothetical protein